MCVLGHSLQLPDYRLRIRNVSYSFLLVGSNLLVVSCWFGLAATASRITYCRFRVPDCAFKIPACGFCLARSAKSLAKYRLQIDWFKILGFHVSVSSLYHVIQRTPN